MRSRIFGHISLRFCALPLLLLGSQLCSAALAKQDDFKGPGPFEVSMSSIDGQGLMFAPAGSSPQGSWPAIVFAHGLCGPAEKYSSTLTRLASWGFVVLASQQQGDCGVMNVDHPFTTLGNLFQLPVKFSNAVDFSGMADDIRSNLRYLQSRSDVDPKRLALMGHSMGGAVGVKRAAADDRIELLVSLAGMVHTAKFAKVEFGEETPGSGFMWGKKDCPLSRAFVDDMNQIGSVLDLGGQIKVPWLLVHGTVDDVVPIAESREIFAQAQDPKELGEIENCDHVFDAETDPESLPIMVRKVTEWLLPKTMASLQS